jgi:hypothetical protein
MYICVFRPAYDLRNPNPLVRFRFSTGRSTRLFQFIFLCSCQPPRQFHASRPCLPTALHCPCFMLVPLSTQHMRSIYPGNLPRCKHPSTPHRLIHYILRITSLPPSTSTTSSLQHHLSSRISDHAMNTPLEPQDLKSDHGGTETQLTIRDSGLMDVS